MTLPPTASKCLWLRKFLKQRCLLCTCQPLMHLLSISLSSFGNHSPLRPGAPQPPSPPQPPSLLSALPHLMLPAPLLKGERPFNHCLPSSPNSGFRIWPCSWQRSPNLVVSHREAIPYFWSSLLFMKLCPFIFLLRGGEGPAQSWRYGYTMARALRIFSAY